MNKRNITFASIVIAILVIFYINLKNIYPREYVSACFVKTVSDMESDYSDMLKKLNVKKQLNDYTIETSGGSYSISHRDALSVNSDNDSNESLQELLYDYQYIKNFYKTLNVKKTGSETVLFGTNSVHCNVYTVSVNRDKLDEFLGHLRTADTYICVKRSILDAANSVAANLGLEISESDITSLLDGMTPEKDKLAAGLSDEIRIHIYVHKNRVFRISADIDFENISLENLIADIKLSDGKHMLNRLDFHLSAVMRGKKLYFDTAVSGNPAGDSAPLGINASSSVSFDHLNTFDMRLSLESDSAADNFTASGYYKSSGKRTNIRGSGSINFSADKLSIAYRNAKGENTVNIFGSML